MSLEEFLINYDPPLWDLNSLEMAQIPCEECSEYTLDFYACPNEVIENKAICLDCCECHEGDK